MSKAYLEGYIELSDDLTQFSYDDVFFWTFDKRGFSAEIIIFILAAAVNTMARDAAAGDVQMNSVDPGYSKSLWLPNSKHESCCGVGRNIIQRSVAIAE